MIRRTTHTLGSVTRMILGAALSLSVLTACADEGTAPLGLSQPSFAISDGAHNGGNQHFFFLPPLVQNAHSNGTFDAGLSPLIEIVDLDTNVTIGTLNADLDNSNSHYHQNWHTNDYDLDPSHTYRLRILLDGVELGYADVDVAANGSELKNVDTGQYIALKDGRTLPIMFRIEDGALPAAPGTVKVTTAVTGAAPGGALAFSVCDALDACDPNEAPVAIDGMTSFMVAPGTFSYELVYSNPTNPAEPCSILAAVTGVNDDPTGSVSVAEGMTSELTFIIECEDGGF